METNTPGPFECTLKVLLLANVPPTTVNGLPSHGRLLVGALGGGGARGPRRSACVVRWFRRDAPGVPGAGATLPTAHNQHNQHETPRRAGVNWDPSPMPRSFKTVLPGPGRLPAGSTYAFE